MVRILISGASGFVGAPLTAFFQSQNIDVTPLTREQLTQGVDPKALVGFETVIHLAGEPLTLARWSEKKKEAIYQSRVAYTKRLVSTLLELQFPPKLFISASAIGFYGDREDSLLIEESEKGSGFLSDVCQAWEEASLPLKERGIRVVHARFGVVLGPFGGPLSKMVLPYRLGLGGKLGSGEQWLSWVMLDDLIQALNHIRLTPSLHGAVNIVSPNPVRQSEFAATLASLLHRPHACKVPAWVLKMIFGMAAEELLLSSGRGYPAKLLASKFVFNYPDLRIALQYIILQENL